MGEQVQGLVKLSEHPILDKIAKYVNIQVYDRDGGTSSPRIRLELRTKNMDADLLTEILTTQTPCVRCGLPVSPFRKRAEREGGAGRVRGLAGHVYIAIACPLARNYGCCRGSEADHEYVAIRERVCKILGVDPESYSTKRTGSPRVKSPKTTHGEPKSETLPLKMTPADPTPRPLSVEEAEMHVNRTLNDPCVPHPRCPGCHSISWVSQYLDLKGQTIPPSERYMCTSCGRKDSALNLLAHFTSPMKQGKPRSDEEIVDAFLATKNPVHPKCPSCEKNDWTKKNEDDWGHPIQRPRYVCKCCGTIALADALKKWIPCRHLGCSCGYCGDGKGDHLCEDCRAQCGAFPSEPTPCSGCEEPDKPLSCRGCGGDEVARCQTCGEPYGAAQSSLATPCRDAFHLPKSVQSLSSGAVFPKQDVKSSEGYQMWTTDRDGSGSDHTHVQCDADEVKPETPPSVDVLRAFRDAVEATGHCPKMIPCVLPKDHKPPCRSYSGMTAWSTLHDDHPATQDTPDVPITLPRCSWHYRFPDMPNLTPMRCSLDAGHECKHHFLDADGARIMEWSSSDPNACSNPSAEHEAVVEFLRKYRKATRSVWLPEKQSQWLGKNVMRAGVPVCTVVRIISPTMKISFTTTRVVVAYPAQGDRGQYEHILTPEQLKELFDPKKAGKP